MADASNYPPEAHELAEVAFTTTDEGLTAKRQQFDDLTGEMDKKRRHVLKLINGQFREETDER